MNARPRVVIAGGGFAALEAVLGLDGLPAIASKSISSLRRVSWSTGRYRLSRRSGSARRRGSTSGRSPTTRTCDCT